MENKDETRETRSGSKAVIILAYLLLLCFVAIFLTTYFWWSKYKSLERKVGQSQSETNLSENTGSENAEDPQTQTAPQEPAQQPQTQPQTQTQTQTGSYLPYQQGYIKFKVTINQTRSGADSSADKVLDTFRKTPVNCVLSLPKTYSQTGARTKLVMVCHGAGKGVDVPGSTDNWTDSDGYNNIVKALNDAGYAVFDCNGAGNELYFCSFWGEKRGVEAYSKAYQYVINHYNVEDQFSVYGFSMGGMTAIEIAELYPSHVRCLALGSPVTNLEAIYNNPGSPAGMIADLYGMQANGPYDASKTIGCDPMLSVQKINGKDYFMQDLPPMKVWFGTNETQPSPADAKRIVQAVNNSNGVAYFRSVSGRGHEICYGMDDAVIQEVLLWINRYNY